MMKPLLLLAGLLPSSNVNIPQVTADGGKTDLIINAITGIAASVAILMVVISGFRLVISAGDPQAVGSSTKMIIYSIAGLVVIIAARVLVGVVLGKLG